MKLLPVTAVLPTLNKTLEQRLLIAQAQGDKQTEREMSALLTQLFHDEYGSRTGSLAAHGSYHAIDLGLGAANRGTAGGCQSNICRVDIYKLLDITSR